MTPPWKTHARIILGQRAKKTCDSSVCRPEKCTERGGLPGEKIGLLQAWSHIFLKPALLQRSVSYVFDFDHALHLRVVVEGVETVEQFTALGQFHCDAVPGYDLSRPLPAGEAEILLRTQGQAPNAGREG